MDRRRPRLLLSITPRLLQDTLTVALSPHADVVDLTEWRKQRLAGDELPVFDVAVVSGGPLPSSVDAGVVIDIDEDEGVPTLDSIHAHLRALTAGEA